MAVMEKGVGKGERLEAMAIYHGGLPCHEWSEMYFPVYKELNP